MLRYLADAVLLAIISSMPYLISRLRLQSSRSRKAMYDAARAITVMPKDPV